MKDGYYLSVYMHINPLAHASENYYRHDQNLSLWKVSGNTTELIHYWELERLTRLKQHKYACYSNDQALEIIQRCLSEYHISMEDINGIWGTPGISTIDLMHLHETSVFADFPLHNVAHIFSGFPIKKTKKVLCLAVDQGPDNILKSGYDYQYHYLGVKYENGVVSSPVPLKSPALLWFELSELIGLKEGTLMALASASTCRFKDADTMMQKLLELNLYDSRNLCYLKKTLKALYDSCFTDEDKITVFCDIDERFSEKDNALSALMKIIQEFSIHCMEYNVKTLISEFQLNPSEFDLSITGGYALNCPTNTYLMQKFNFKQFTSPPCVSDTGISLGMAQYFFYLSRINTDGLTGAYYGDSEDISEEKLRVRFKDCISVVEAYCVEKAIEDIITHPIVWFQGRSEVGPRALGNRSLIADPRSNQAKDILNQIKCRQWWRPVAPIIMEEHVTEWFQDSYASPYMLQTFSVKKDKESSISAVLHLDKTARVQTVNQQDNPKLYFLLEEFYKRTGVPVLCNTSLNDRGEPIVNTPEEAIVFALRKKISIVYINNYRITLHNFEQYDNVMPLQPLKPFRKTEEELRKLRLKYNPWRLSEDIIQFYFDFPLLSKKYNLLKENDVINIKKLYKEFEKKWGK